MSRKEALERLANAPWLGQARIFLDCLDGDKGSTRAVGGLVRDTLLDMARSHADIDLATILVPEEVMARAQAAGLGAHPTGIAHGTVTLVYGDAVAEVTTLRNDVETDGRHARVVFGTDWAADAARRDFTMNALYADPDGELFDPLGGLEDCLARRVRFIGDPDKRIAEDRLRVYRYFRFTATHGGQRFDEAALAACARATDRLERISAERVGAEMMRLLEAPLVAQTLCEMVRIGVLDARLMGSGTLRWLEDYEALPIIPDARGRLALILAAGIKADDLKDRWRLSNAVTDTARRIFEACGDAMFGDGEAIVYKLPQHKGTALAVAAVLGDKGPDWFSERWALAEAMSPGPFPLNGNDLKAIGYLPGPAMGVELKRLERLWIESGFVKDKATLLRLARPPGSAEG